MLNELTNLAEGHELSLIGVAVILLSGLVQVSKIELNPWSAVGRLLLIPVTKVRDVMIAPLLNEFVALSTRFIKLSEDVELINQALKDVENQRHEELKTNIRRSILRFGDECRIGTEHSQEMFNEVLRDISRYEKYVDLTKDPNHVLTSTIGIINEAYEKCLRDNDFL